MSTLAAYDYAAWNAARARDHEAKMARFDRFLVRYQSYNAAVRERDLAFAYKILDEHREADREQEREGAREPHSEPRVRAAAKAPGERR